MITTRRLHIVPFTGGHVTDQYIAWLNDPEVVRFSEQRYTHHTRQTCRTYFESFKGTANYFWSIELRPPAGGNIGTMTAYVDTHNSVADVGILIGERSAWGRGYGLEAWQAVCVWLFKTVQVRKITAGCAATNTAMVSIMERSGMVPDGVRQGQQLIDGQPVDVVYMALFRV